MYLVARKDPKLVKKLAPKFYSKIKYFERVKADRIVDDIIRKYKPKIIGSSVITPQTSLKSPPRKTARS